MSGSVQAARARERSRPILVVAACLLALSAQGAWALGPSKWITLAKSGNGDVVQADAATVQRSGTQRAVWIRHIRARPTTKGVKSSTSLVWLDCAKRTFNLMVQQDGDQRGVPIAQRSFGERGKGFEPITRGSAVDTVARTVCAA